LWIQTDPPTEIYLTRKVVLERGPEKAGVGGSIPSLATIIFSNLHNAPEKSGPALYPRLVFRKEIFDARIDQKTISRYRSSSGIPI
jgi:hypothetical protein